MQEQVRDEGEKIGKEIGEKISEKNGTMTEKNMIAKKMLDKNKDKKIYFYILFV